jgi:hypothetical protein
MHLIIPNCLPQVHNCCACSLYPAAPRVWLSLCHRCFVAPGNILLTIRSQDTHECMGFPAYESTDT